MIKVKSNKLILLVVAITMFLSIALVGCTSTTSTPTPSATAAKQVPTASNPMVIDTEKQTISIYTQVNGTYFTEDTRHGVVFNDGSNGEKAILRALADEKLFDAALLSLSAKPGKNIAIADMSKGIAVEGSDINVTVEWDGQTAIPFSKIVKSSVDREFKFKFGGNIENANSANTGCILCLDSCAVGIVSNSAWVTGSTQSAAVKFWGDDSVLPADGSGVVVTFSLA